MIGKDIETWGFLPKVAYKSSTTGLVGVAETSNKYYYRANCSLSVVGFNETVNVKRTQPGVFLADLDCIMQAYEERIRLEKERNHYLKTFNIKTRCDVGPVSTQLFPFLWYTLPSVQSSGDCYMALRVKSCQTLGLRDGSFLNGRFYIKKLPMDFWLFHGHQGFETNRLFNELITSFKNSKEVKTWRFCSL